MAKRNLPHEGSDLDMTPMIDVVFQLMIFFIVTIKMEADVNKDIILEPGKNGPIVKGEDPRMLVVEVDRRGTISIHNARMDSGTFKQIMRARVARIGQNFTVLVRGDKRARHKDIRKVMDICSSVGIWKIQFAAIKEYATEMRK